MVGGILSWLEASTTYVWLEASVVGGKCGWRQVRTIICPNRDGRAQSSRRKQCAEMGLLLVLVL